MGSFNYLSSLNILNNRNILVMSMSPRVTRIVWDRQGSNPIADLGFAVLESPGDCIAYLNGELVRWDYEGRYHIKDLGGGRYLACAGDDVFFIVEGVGGFAEVEKAIDTSVQP
jgi:hypothetical protein